MLHTGQLEIQNEHRSIVESEEDRTFEMETQSSAEMERSDEGPNKNSSAKKRDQHNRINVLSAGVRERFKKVALARSMNHKQVELRMHTILRAFKYPCSREIFTINMERKDVRYLIEFMLVNLRIVPQHWQ